MKKMCVLLLACLALLSLLSPAMAAPTQYATVVETDQVSVSVTGLEADELWGYNLQLSLENKTELTLMYSMDDVVVNGCGVDSLWDTEVEPGETCDSIACFRFEDLARYGISTLDEVVFRLRIYDSENWSADSIVDDVFAIYPSGSPVVYPERATVEGESLAIDDDSAAFAIQSVDPEGLWGYTLHCCLENKTDCQLMFSWNDVTVNGLNIDPFWACTVPPHSWMYSDIRFFKEDFEENNVEAVESIQYRLSVYNNEDWDEENLLDSTFTYQP